MKSCSFLGCLWGRCQVWSPAGRHRETGHPLGWENSFYSMLAALSLASHGIPPFNPAASHLINFKPREPCSLLVLFNGEMALGESRWFAYSWLCVHPRSHVSVFSLPVRVLGVWRRSGTCLPSLLGVEVPGRVCLRHLGPNVFQRANPSS